MTGPNTWVLRYQVFRETGLYDGFSVTGRTELFFSFNPKPSRQKKSSWQLGRTTFAWLVSHHR